MLRSGVQRNGDRLVVPLPLPETRYAASYGDRAARTLPFRLTLDRLDDWEIELELGDDVRVATLPPAVAVARPPLAGGPALAPGHGAHAGRVRAQRQPGATSAEAPLGAGGDRGQ